jgi:hypothetical protein
MERQTMVDHYRRESGCRGAMVNPSLDTFVAEALSKNVSLELMTHPTGQHAFDVLDDHERSRQIIARALGFARTHLTAGRSTVNRTDGAGAAGRPAVGDRSR